MLSHCPSPGTDRRVVLPVQRRKTPFGAYWLPLFCVLVLLTGLSIPAHAQKPELVVQTGHSNHFTSVAFSPDGKTIACGSEDGTIELWDAARGLLLRTFAGHTAYVASVTFSPDGKTFASSSRDCTVKLWDAATGRLLRTLANHTFLVNSVALSPDGKALACSSDDLTVRLWDAATGRLLKTIAGGGNWVFFSPDSKTLASSRWGTIRALGRGHGAGVEDARRPR